MKRDDSVFFFTLVDFLVTTLFFGLVLYVWAGDASAAAVTKQNDQALAVKRIAGATGVSDLTELTDRLTRLGPIKDIEQTKAYVDSIGGLGKLQEIQALVRAAGGIDSLAAALVKLRRQEGYGKPPCRFVMAPDGRKSPIDIARARATDSTISLVTRFPPFDSLVTRLGIVLPPGGVFTLGEFRRDFARVSDIEPDCRFWIEFVEQTRYVDARDSAYVAFSLHRVRQR